MNEAPTPQVEEVGQSNNHGASNQIKPAQAGNGNGSSTRPAAAAAGRMHAGMAGKGKRCLLLVLCLPVRFVASFFFLSLHSTPTPTPRHMQGGSQARGRDGGGEKRNYVHYSSRKARCHRPPIPPITTQSEHQSQSGQGSRDIVEEAQRATGGGPAWARAPEKRYLAQT